MSDTAAMAASAVSAYIQCIELPIPPIVFPYNPKAFTENVTVSWRKSTQPKGKSTKPQYQGVQPRTIDVEIILDAFAIPPIPPTVTIELLKLMTEPTPQSQAMRASSAPMVVFGWGPNVVMSEAIITKLVIAHERFLLGLPTRTKVTVGLQEVPSPDPLPGTNPTSGGLATRRTRTVVEGDTLASIAYQEYRDPNYWRALAEANGIDDPMRIKSGTVLAVPDKRDAEALLGTAS
jgi:nucleoid-associated protein YgaU